MLFVLGSCSLESPWVERWLSGRSGEAMGANRLPGGTGGCLSFLSTFSPQVTSLILRAFGAFFMSDLHMSGEVWSSLITFIAVYKIESFFSHILLQFKISKPDTHHLTSTLPSESYLCVRVCMGGPGGGCWELNLYSLAHARQVLYH